MNNRCWIFWPFRCAITLAWLVIIAALLYSPNFFNVFRSEKSITIFTWPLIIDGKVLRAFETETGIKVYVSYYESNQELLQKLQSHHGPGYDIIIPSDYAVEQLIALRKIKKLDRARLQTIFARIVPQLQDHYFDPGNKYSLPYYWSLYGIGFDKRFFKDKVPTTWDALFDVANIKYAIGMTSDPREAILLAAFYLFGSIDGLDDPKKIEQIKQLLREQKKRITVYTDLRLDDVLISGQAPLVMGVGTDMMRAKKESEFVEFIVPKQGTFLNIDSLVVSADTQKDDLIYQFIEYIYQPNIAAWHSKVFGTYQPVVDAPVTNQGLPYLQPGAVEQILFFKNVLTSQQINNIWIDILSR